MGTFAGTFRCELRAGLLPVVLTLRAGRLSAIGSYVHPFDDDFGVDVVACIETLFAKSALGYPRSLVIRCREGGNEIEIDLTLRPVN